MKRIFLVTGLFASILVMAQKNIELPYYEIPKPAEVYTAGTSVSRMIDGLGFRFYWATEGLVAKDLAYRPSEMGRTSGETLQHIYELSNFILSSISKEFKADESSMTFKEKRRQTLLNFKKASDILRDTKDLSEFNNERFPFWNIINGPIADALWHCGQIVMLRRASGNPFNAKVSVFTGKLRD